jgi:hypothetical protein
MAMPNVRDPRAPAVGARATLAGRLWSPDQPGGLLGRIWRALHGAYAVVGIALHVALGVLFGLGYWSLPWWFVTLMMVAWAALWVPAVRLLRSRPGAVPFVVFPADLAIWFGFGAIADAVGWM